MPSCFHLFCRLRCTSHFQTAVNRQGRVKRVQRRTQSNIFSRHLISSPCPKTTMSQQADALSRSLNNREAKRELDVFVDNKRLVFQQAPKYLGVRLDRMLNFKQHLEQVAGKVTSRVSLIRRLAGTTWGASAKTLRISTQAMVFPAAEYCAPVWSRSPHVRKVDVAIKSSLRTISGCLKPTPVFQLPVLAGIAPAGLRRKAATLALARKAVKHDWHILHDTTKNEVPPCRLKSRKPYNKEAQEMLSVIPEDRSKDAWIAATWKQEWEASGPTRVHRHISDPG